MRKVTLLILLVIGLAGIALAAAGFPINTGPVISFLDRAGILWDASRINPDNPKEGCYIWVAAEELPRLLQALGRDKLDGIEGYVGQISGHIVFRQMKCPRGRLPYTPVPKINPVPAPALFAAGLLALLLLALGVKKTGVLA